MAEEVGYVAVVKPTAREMGEEFGRSVPLPFATTWTPPEGQGEPSIEYLRGIGDETDKPTVAQLAEMRRQDGQARALYRLITVPIRSALKGMTFVPAEGGEKEAEFIEQMLTLPPNGGGMSSSFSQIIAEMLMAVFDGFAAFEQVYYIPKTGPLKGKICLRKLAHRPADTITFLLDDTGGFNGLRQRTYFKGQAIDIGIPRDRALYFAVQEEERPFYGVSYFQSAFYHYDAKRKLYWLAHLAAQTRAVGTRIGEVPQSASERDKANFRAALEDFGVMQAMTLPPGFKVTNTFPSGSFDYLQLINHHNSQMSKSVLASFFDEQQGGDRTLVDFGKQSDALFLMSMQSLMGDIAYVINTYLIPKFVDWNFGTSKYPTFSWGSFTDEQKESIQKTFDRLSTAGQTLTVSDDFVFELEKLMADDLGLQIDYEAVEAERAEEKEFAKQQQRQMALFGGGFDGAGGVGGTVDNTQDDFADDTQAEFSRPMVETLDIE